MLFPVPNLMKIGSRQRYWGTARMELDVVLVCVSNCSYLKVTLNYFSLFGAGPTFPGIDAPGHIAEETKNARYGILESQSWSQLFTTITESLLHGASS